MPVVVDNNFSLDTYGMRSERLIAIQSNFDSLQPDLSAPANIATWAEDCYDVYANLLALSELEANESEGATVVVSEKEAALDEVYQYVKNMGLTIYKDMPKLIEDYGFEFTYPLRRDDKIACADKVILCYNRHVAALVTPLIPQVMITRLEDAKDEFKTAIGNQDKERSDARHAVATISEQFAKDTQKLNELKIWAYAMLGKQDPRMGLIGMVNPGTGGGVKKIAAPANLRYETDYMKVVWDAVENATSYSLEVSNDGVNFTELSTTTDPEFSYIPYDAHSWFRVRSRSANGYSEYSNTINFWYYDPLPAPSNFQAVIVPGHQFKLSWDLIHSVTSYKIYISDVPFGDPESTFTLLYETSALEYTGALTPGRRFYFKVTSNNSYQPESGFSSTEYLEVTGV
jgi:hypothetical protein